MIPDIMKDGVLIDTSIALYALGAEDPRKGPCRRFLARVTSGKGYAYASTEMIQEATYHRLRVSGKPRLAAADVRKLMSALTILKFDYEVLDTSLKLIEQLPGVRGRDAVHAATALVYGIPTIASSDASFDLVPGITRVDPTVHDPKGIQQP